MSITDELREFAASEASDYNDWVDGIYAIADNIDAAHRSALEKLAAQVDETSDMREFCGRIEQAANNREDVTLWGVDYTPLPVDADGVPIRIGDVMDVGIVFAIGDEGVFMVENGFSGKYDVECFDGFACHHHTPTVEDVLREFAREIDADAYGITDAKITEFAAKLRLAGEDA